MCEMNPNPSVYAILPARSGSKGVQKKNLRLLRGIPLVAHSVLAARDACCVSRILLSTNCPEIADAGKRFGAEVPFLRPNSLAEDDSIIAEAVRHLLDRLGRTEVLPDYILLLQPTSPFRTAADIDAAFALMCEKDADAIVSVSEAASHPLLCRSIDAGGVLTPFIESPLNNARRQDLPPAYALNGALYLLKTQLFLEEGRFSPSGAIAYVMPAERSLDIDLPEDFERAESLMQRKLKGCSAQC